jgi:hypothetical protein
MVVVAIVGLLTSIAIPMFNDYRGRVRQAEALQIIEKVAQAEIVFFLKPRHLANGNPANPCFLFAEGGASTIANGGPAPWSNGSLPGERNMTNVLGVTLGGPAYYWIYTSPPAAGAAPYCANVNSVVGLAAVGSQISIVGNGNTDGIPGGDAYAAGCGIAVFKQPPWEDLIFPNPGFLTKRIFIGAGRQPNVRSTSVWCSDNSN